MDLSFMRLNTNSEQEKKLPFRRRQSNKVQIVLMFVFSS